MTKKKPKKKAVNKKGSELEAKKERLRMYFEAIGLSPVAVSHKKRGYWLVALGDTKLDFKDLYDLEQLLQAREDMALLTVYLHDGHLVLELFE